MIGFPLRADRRDAIALAGAAAALGVATGAPAKPASAKPASGRDQPFDDGWRFFRGAGEGLEAPGLDDSGWRSVDLPHDWSIEDLPGGAGADRIGPFRKDAVGETATGFTEGGEGWYRKHFSAAGFPADARVEVSFDGIYLESEIWLNGQPVGGNVHGYRPFAVDLTAHLNRSGPNVLAVRVRNLGRNSRWYAGSGIYRLVRLDVLPAGARIARWGVGAWTRRLADGAATVDLATTIDSPAVGLTLVNRLRDAAGRVAAEAQAALATDATVAQSLTVPAPHLWSPANPYLYTLETELRRGAAVEDRMVQPFGIRIVTMDPQRGVAINGTPIRLRGGCIHHDNGLLGACAFPAADERRIRLLQARGFTAIRSSHNTISRSLRETCDRLGMLVVDEAFDAWFIHKEPQDFAAHFKDHWEEVVRAMVLSARNSPSVILWSIGNEIPDRSTPEGVEWQWKLANAVKRLDPTRPVTAGLNGVLGAPLVAAEGTARPGRAAQVDNASTVFLDVAGYNYRLDDIEKEHGPHPERLVIATETFPREVFDYAALMDRAPWFLGEFVWTALDYIGEAGLGATAWLEQGVPYYKAGWPWVNAWCGDLDLIGQQKAPSFARDVAWGLSPLELAVQRPVPAGKMEFVAPWGWSDELKSWTWPGAEGRELAVRVYAAADRVDLLLNGVKVAEAVPKPAGGHRAEFKVTYAPGTLEAVAFRGGREVARRKLETTGAPARLRLRAENANPGASRQNLGFVGLEVLDSAGRLVPDAELPVSLAITGPAGLAAFGSANPLAVGSFQALTARTFHGRALAILRGTGTAGPVRLTAQGPGLASATTELKFS